MPKIIIDSQELEVENGLTIIQACEIAGKEIPRFCFHERLNIAGNCRMCLVEVANAPKLVASCAMQVADGMKISTDTPKVQKARAGVLELLLINHPLDCPVCDQGGECDLQDQAFKYGNGKNRFTENKRIVPDKYMGPLIETHMTRCIHCTRCIRFATEIAGVPEIGALYRGEHMEITSYLEKSLSSELSGNIIDLCPVGALNSKPYAFKGRKWEFVRTESIDVMDAVGSNIRIDTRGLEVMRILPKLNEDINEEWIADKARFSYDGLKYQRLDVPYIRKNGNLFECSWDEALSTVAEKMSGLKGDEMAAIAGFLTNTEAMFCLKSLLHSFDCYNLTANQYNYCLDTSQRGNYLFNTTIANIEKADVCLLVGANPRISAPVLNSRIGRMVRSGKLLVARVGEVNDQTYKILELGANPKILCDILSGDNQMHKLLSTAKNPMIIVGDGAYSRVDGYAILSLVHKIIEKYNVMRSDWRGFNVLHNHASIVGSLDIGFTPVSNGKNIKQILDASCAGEIKFIYLLGADEFDMDKVRGSFVVYQGHHGDKGAEVADVIFPSPSYTEQDAIYINLEGRAQKTRAATMPLGHAKQDWKIIRDLARKLTADLNISIIDNLTALRRIMEDECGVMSKIDVITDSAFTIFNSSDRLLENDITNVPVNYYMTDVISRSSVTMAKCTEVQRERGDG